MEDINHIEMNQRIGKVNILQNGRGRGITQKKILPNECVCLRPISSVLCNVCGFLTKGRVRYQCPMHPQTIYLFDITQCPQCKSFDFMLTEF